MIVYKGLLFLLLESFPLQFEWQQLSSSLPDSSQYSSWSQQFCSLDSLLSLFPSPQVLVPILWTLYQQYQLQLV